MLLPQAVRDGLKRAKAETKRNLDQHIDQLFEILLERDEPLPSSQLSTTIYLDLAVSLPSNTSADVSTTLSFLPEKPDVWHFGELKSNSTTSSCSNSNAPSVDVPLGELSIPSTVPPPTGTMPLTQSSYPLSSFLAQYLPPKSSQTFTTAPFAVGPHSFNQELQITSYKPQRVSISVSPRQVVSQSRNESSLIYRPPKKKHCNVLHKELNAEDSTSEEEDEKPVAKKAKPSDMLSEANSVFAENFAKRVSHLKDLIKKNASESTRPQESRVFATAMKPASPEFVPETASLDNVHFFKILYLDCLEVGCAEQFMNTDALNDHLLAKHDIHPFRCPIFSCKASFSQSNQLCEHTRVVHESLHTWECYCRANFSNYLQLSEHYAFEHFSGLFSCTIGNCTFQSITRSKMHAHYGKEHFQDVSVTMMQDETKEIQEGEEKDSIGSKEDIPDDK